MKMEGPQLAVLGELALFNRLAKDCSSILIRPPLVPIDMSKVPYRGKY